MTTENNSNSAKMSFEDKIVETIKNEKIFAMVGDEDALFQLVDKAIRKALFEPVVKSTDGYGRKNTEPSPIEQAAVKYAKILCRKRMSVMFEEILKDEEVKKQINEAIAITLPAELKSIMGRALSDHIDCAAMEARNKVSDAIRNQTI
jgi:hypothetical protein